MKRVVINDTRVRAGAVAGKPRSMGVPLSISGQTARCHALAKRDAEDVGETEAKQVQGELCLQMAV